MRQTPEKKHAFTLIELLVVIGIIAVLLALLLPALSRARKQATQVACLAHLRQVGHGMLGYAHEHKGWFPAPAAASVKNVIDWVHWHPDRDIRDSAIFPYIGRSGGVLKCPGGVPARGPTVVGTSNYPPYPFSYSVNLDITSYTYSGGDDLPRARWHAGPSRRLNEIVSPSLKILMLEEDVRLINDGAWAPGNLGDPVPAHRTALSLLHDKDSELNPRGNQSDYYFRAPGRGNVFFVDGHCEFFERTRAQHPAHCDPLFTGPPP